MSTVDLPVVGKVHPDHAYKIALSFAALSIAYFIGWTVYDVFFGPMSKFPGPKLRAVTIIPAILTVVNGDDNTDHVALHAQYGPVVRTGPRNITYANGALGFKDIYGFGKKALIKDPSFYGKPINKVHSLISSDDATHSRQRKILSNAFSDRALKEQEPLLKQWVQLMKTKLQEQAEAGNKVDMLKFYNCTTFGRYHVVSPRTMTDFDTDIMGDLTFGEGLNMLEDSEYSPWVKTIFESIKGATFFRGVKMYSKLTDYLVEEVLFKTETARKKQIEHWNYSKDRVDKRLAKKTDRPDLWTKILEKSEGPDGLSLEEHHSIASLFVSLVPSAMRYTM